MKRNRNSLLIWKPTGNREENAVRSLWMMVSSPTFLVAVAVVDIAAMIYFNLNQRWVWAIAPSAIGLAIISILLRLRSRKRLLTSKRQAKKCNRFDYAASWLPNRYLNYIDLESERTAKDSAISRLLYQNVAESLVTLGIYEETKHTKVSVFTGDESLLIAPVEFYADLILSAGIGYVLFMPPVSLIPKINAVDERIISRTLREIGHVQWTVERISYDDDLVLFILKDEAVSRAFDFSGE